MKTLVTICAVFISCSVASGAVHPFKFHKHRIKPEKGLVYIPGGRALLETGNGIVPAKNDSTLLIENLPLRVRASPFFISDHEVSNREYREFVDWVRDSVALSLFARKDASWYADSQHKILNWQRREEIWKMNPDKMQTLAALIRDAGSVKNRFAYQTQNIIYEFILENKPATVPVYPDTTVWIRNTTYNAPYMSYYFRHPAYQDYPVVGISWVQAKAFCDWKTRQSKGFGNTKRKTTATILRYDLPTEAEWDFAAQGAAGIHSFRIFPWAGMVLRNGKGKVMANYKPAEDENGLWMDNPDIDFVITSKMKSYPPNGFMLYDMGGNVAEWTKDLCVDVSPDYLDYISGLCHANGDSLKIAARRSLDSVHTNTVIFETDNLETAKTKLKKRLDYYCFICTKAHAGQGPVSVGDLYRIPDDTGRLGVAYFSQIEIHNARVAGHCQSPRIIKGGSWRKPPVYMLLTNREVRPEYGSDAMTGFRVIARPEPGR